MFRRYSACCAAIALLLLPGCGRRGAADSGGDGGEILLSVNVDPGQKTFAISERMAEEFRQSTGVRVRLIAGPNDSTERLSQYLQFLGAKSPDIDVYQVDVIWPALLETHLLDLTNDFATEAEDFFPGLIANNTVNGKLLAIPWFADAGMMFYRKDLLQKYGLRAPETWDELTTVAARIQEGERAVGRPDFWGYVWQGKAYEGLTCDALEWQASATGQAFVTHGKVVHVLEEPVARAFERAAGWVGTISPRGVTSYGEEDARQMFQNGNAAFMRNWPYAYALCASDESAVRGKFDVAPMPSGGKTHAATLGGWELGVSKYTRHPREAVEFVRFFTSREALKARALEASMLPTRVALYDDPEIAQKVPFLPTMKQVFLQAVPRPSSATGADYNEVSTYYFQAVHEVLTKQKPAAEAMRELDAELNKVLH